MGLIVPSAMHPERADQSTPYEWFVGIDWGSQQHQVCVLDRDRRLVGERTVDHDGASLAQLAAWLWTLSVGQPQRVSVAIEVPRGAMVEGLLERGFHVFAMNPKQRDRFRDRHSVAGKMTGAMPLSLLTQSGPITPVFVGSNWMNRTCYCYESSVARKKRCSRSSVGVPIGYGSSYTGCIPRCSSGARRPMRPGCGT
jgi:transposase